MMGAATAGAALPEALKKIESLVSEPKKQNEEYDDMEAAKQDAEIEKAELEYQVKVLFTEYNRYDTMWREDAELNHTNRGAVSSGQFTLVEMGSYLQTLALIKASLDEMSERLAELAQAIEEDLGNTYIKRLISEANPKLNELITNCSRAEHMKGMDAYRKELRRIAPGVKET